MQSAAFSCIQQEKTTCWTFFLLSLLLTAFVIHNNIGCCITDERLQFFCFLFFLRFFKSSFFSCLFSRGWETTRKFLTEFAIFSNDVCINTETYKVYEKQILWFLTQSIVHDQEIHFIRLPSLSNTKLSIKDTFV